MFQNFAFVKLIALTMKVALWSRGRHYKIKFKPLSVAFEALCELSAFPPSAPAPWAAVCP